MIESGNRDRTKTYPCIEMSKKPTQCIRRILEDGSGSTAENFNLDRYIYIGLWQNRYIETFNWSVATHAKMKTR